MELTPNGFIELNLMEACDPEGGQDELWVTLESMGYSRTLQLAKVQLNKLGFASEFRGRR